MNNDSPTPPTALAATWPSSFIYSKVTAVRTAAAQNQMLNISTQSGFIEWEHLLENVTAMLAQTQ